MLDLLVVCDQLYPVELVVFRVQHDQRRNFVQIELRQLVVAAVQILDLFVVRYVQRSERIVAAVQVDQFAASGDMHRRQLIVAAVDLDQLLVAVERELGEHVVIAEQMLEVREL